MERLQKVIAQAGIASRRKAEQLILDGRVKVNGQVVTVLGTTVSKDDIVYVDNKTVEKEELVYYLLNKPKKFVCTAEDEHDRNKVVDLIDCQERIFPVGRLDYDSTGMLILTNDGNFANMLIHPKFHVEKTYRVTIKGILSKSDILALKRGVTLDDGYKTQPAIVNMVNYDNEAGKCTVMITIFEGKNRQVRRMIESLGCEVSKLHRVSFGTIRDDNMGPGDYRRLRPHELKTLKNLAQKGSAE